MLDETPLKHAIRSQQEEELLNTLGITRERARRPIAKRRSQEEVESVIRQIVESSVHLLVKRQRVQENNRRKTVVAVAKPIFLWVMSAEEAELEAGELAELFEYSLRSAQGSVLSLIGPVLLWLSLPYQVFCGAWLHRRKRLAQRKGEK